MKLQRNDYRSKSKTGGKLTIADMTFIKILTMDSCATGGEPSLVDVKNGRIVRIRPLHWDWKHKKEEMPWWEIKARGKVFEPTMKSLTPPYALAYKNKVYAPSRILYPLKRVDWDPNGERNPQNRGKSKYKRISWDEATDLIVSEIKRIHEKYGPYALLAQGEGHGETKTVHGPHGCQLLLLQHMGGYMLQVWNADSWEGWYWGTKHVWGDQDWGQLKANNCLKDISENADLLLFWGCDPETTPWGFGGQLASRMCYWFTELGIKSIYICPDLNYGAAVHADKWIPILPNTDAALHLAIAYIWITEGTYDKDYIATHTVGFDRCKDYILGKEDGIPKTPEWASPLCGVPEWTIKALARKWASQITSIVHYFGGSKIRGPYSHEPARLEALNLAMQGLGKPGVHQYQICFWRDLPRIDMVIEAEKELETYEMLAAWSGRLMMTLTKQIISRTLVHEAILNPPVTSSGSASLAESVEDQFKKYTYPIPEEEGGTEIHMIWCDSPCRTTCGNDGNKMIEALRSPKIECVIVQHPQLHDDCLFADIILPVNTKLEEEDICYNVEGTALKCIALEGQCIQPLGESKSDYEIVGEVAKKVGLYDKYTEGKTVREWMKVGFDNFKAVKKGLMRWEELNEKGYCFFPLVPDWEKDPPGLRKFYEDPEKNPLDTPSGKLEFYSQRLAEHFPDDNERPPYPKWIAEGETHQESQLGERAKKYPLLIVSNHGRWRVHAQNDEISWLREIPTCKVKGPDGYKYEPVWLHPSDAAKRGIKSGDIVKVYNERGTVLGGAIVWERIMPGATYMDHGARYDPIIPGKVDRGGAINLISPTNIISKNCPGQATSGYLVEVERVSAAEMEEWRNKYPDTFEREYDPAYGTTFNAWVERGT